MHVRAVKSLCASAARDEKSGDIILKVVNASAEALKIKIDLKGSRKDFRETEKPSC